MSDNQPKAIDAGVPVRDTLAQAALDRLPSEVVEKGVWGEMTFDRFYAIFLGKDKNPGEQVKETIAACIQDKEGNELMSVDQVGGLPLSVGKALSACVDYVQRQAGTADLDEELEDPNA